MRRILNKIQVPVFEIEVSYDTQRGNNRTQNFRVAALDEYKAKQKIEIWIWSFNEKHPYRAYLNVKILSVKQLNTEEVEI